jgi:peroxiredoxin
VTISQSSLRRPATILLEVLLVVAVFLGVSAFQTRKHLSGEAAPEFTLVELDGKRVSLSAYRNKKVLLHFWATWCGVCRVELPSVRSFHRALDDDEVLLSIVEDSDDVEAVRAFAREHELDYPILLGTREALRAYRVSSFPTNYYLNGDGSVRTTSVGLSTRLGMSLRMLFTSAD